jgi:hypothetical protein
VLAGVVLIVAAIGGFLLTRGQPDQGTANLPAAAPGAASGNAVFGAGGDSPFPIFTLTPRFRTTPAAGAPASPSATATAPPGTSGAGTVTVPAAPTP